MAACFEYYSQPATQCQNLYGSIYDDQSMQYLSGIASNCNNVDVLSPAYGGSTDVATCQQILISGAEWTQLNNTVTQLQSSAGQTPSSNAQYDYVDAAAMWGFAFSSVFMLWFLAKNLGLIIDAVKRW